MADGGRDGVMEVAKHMGKSLAVSKNAADDMMRVLSRYEGEAPVFPLSSSPVEAEEEDEEVFAAAEDVIRRCNSSLPPPEMVDYLYAVDDAIAAAELGGQLASRAEEALQAAMPRLEEEVRALLCSSVRRISLDSADGLDDENATPDGSPRRDALSPDAAASVSGVAARMLRAGYGPELAQVYVTVRRDALAESVAHLGVEAVAIEEVLKMEWGILDQKIRRWSHAIRVVVKTLLAGERRLCDEVFASDEELGHECFADVARGCVLQLIGFVEAVAMSPPATEKLYRMLGMYEALTDVEPELDSLFTGDARDFFSAEVSDVVAQLSNTVRHTIDQFVNVIHDESSRRAVQGGEIHPMTRYVLNYCGLLAECRATLDMVLADTKGNNDDSDDDEAPADGASSTPSGRCMRELLTHLLRKLDEKSRLYDDAGLKNIFLMNNLYYIVQKMMELPALRELLGDDWVRRHRGQIRQYETGYLRASWMAVLACLRDDSSPAHSRAALKDKARSFNAAFEELYRSQTAWKVTDPQLREELRIAVSERLIPAYRSFVGRSRTLLESGGSSSRHSAARHIKYSLEDLEDYMLDFFEGVQKFVR
ncbi:exocyst complex component EXO70B1-like [Oryza brachyantha]|uniref:exocyst complex component EXO70B1-like n=1 Tax=Oryza brachyantha TaxID=4533 RepID=UPI001ADCC510|nr:exocyst complex component EXO70B1-like [Oryza brachyantha]